MFYIHNIKYFILTSKIKKPYLSDKAMVFGDDKWGTGKQVRCWLLGAGCWLLGAGYLAGCWEELSA